MRQLAYDLTKISHGSFETTRYERFEIFHRTTEEWREFALSKRNRRKKKEKRNISKHGTIVPRIKN